MYKAYKSNYETFFFRLILVLFELSKVLDTNITEPRILDSFWFSLTAASDITIYNLNYIADSRLARYKGKLFNIHL